MLSSIQVMLDKISNQVLILLVNPYVSYHIPLVVYYKKTTTDDFIFVTEKKKNLLNGQEK